jgi:molecular chaperone GrpE
MGDVSRAGKGPPTPQSSQAGGTPGQRATRHEGGDTTAATEPRANGEQAAGNGEPASGDAVAALEDRLRRSLADLDNLRKRFDREVLRHRVAERASVVAPWLPVVDNLERALQHADTDSASIVEGVRAVREQALSALAQLGFPRFDDIGQPFDPLRHEAVAGVESDAPPGTIVDVVRPGYGTPELILRPAAVVVARRRD